MAVFELSVKNYTVFYSYKAGVEL